MRQRSAAVVDEQPPEVTPEVVASINVPLSKRGDNSIFYPVRDALRILDAGGTGTLWQAANAEPNTDLVITITRNK